MKKIIPTISLVIPVFNEAKNLPLLVAEIKKNLGRKNYELILVDDGSLDKSVEVLEKLVKNNPRLKAIILRKNFGQTAALAAGFDQAQGEIIVTMDGDLQQDPKDIIKIIKKINQGFDVVSGWRFRRQDKFLSRKMPSVIANWVISKVTGVRLHDYGCSLKGYRKEVVENLNLYGEMHRFIPALATWQGAKIAEIKVNHRARKHGISKYGISRTIRVILDLLTVKFLLSYSTKPMQMFGPIGIFSIILGFIGLIYLIVAKFVFDQSIGNRPLLIISIFIVFVGVQIITIGLLGEMMARTYHESQKKKVYSVKKTIA